MSLGQAWGAEIGGGTGLCNYVWSILSALPLASTQEESFKVRLGSCDGQYYVLVTEHYTKREQFLDEYFEAGGNFIDTANIYQNGQVRASTCPTLANFFNIIIS